MTEADYLRGELIAAKGLLAQCRGILNAAQTIAPNLYRLPTVQATIDAIGECSKRGVAVLPEGVK